MNPSFMPKKKPIKNESLKTLQREQNVWGLSSLSVKQEILLCERNKINSLTWLPILISKEETLLKKRVVDFKLFKPLICITEKRLPQWTQPTIQ